MPPPIFFQVCLVNDPRPQNPFGKLYSVEYLGNMVGGRRTLYNNQPIELLKRAAAESIKDGEVQCGSVQSLDTLYCSWLLLLISGMNSQIFIITWLSLWSSNGYLVILALNWAKMHVHYSGTPAQKDTDIKYKQKHWYCYCLLDTNSICSMRICPQIKCNWWPQV